MEKILNDIRKHCQKGCGTTVVMAKVVKFPKTKRGYSLPRPMYMNGVVTKETTYGGVSLGTNYQKSVDNALGRSGVENEYESGKCWHKYFDAFFEVSKKDESKFYLQLQWTNKQKPNIKVRFLIDGVEATKEQEEEIRFWSNDPIEEKVNTRQIEQGVKEAEVREYNCIAVENILMIKQGAMSLRF